MTFTRAEEASPQASSSKSPVPRQNSDLDFLDYLSDDFFCLSRFEVAINQMIRILKSPDALSSSLMQEKVSVKLLYSENTLHSPLHCVTLRHPTDCQEHRGQP